MKKKDKIVLPGMIWVKDQAACLLHVFDTSSQLKHKMSSHQSSWLYFLKPPYGFPFH